MPGAPWTASPLGPPVGLRDSLPQGGLSIEPHEKLVSIEGTSGYTCAWWLLVANGCYWLLLVVIGINAHCSLSLAINGLSWVIHGWFSTVINGC